MSMKETCVKNVSIFFDILYMSYTYSPYWAPALLSYPREEQNVGELMPGAGT